MKKVKLLLMLFISLSMINTSCKKSEDPAEPATPTETYKGSYSLNLNGTTYNELKSDVWEAEEGVTFYADNKKGAYFQVAIPNIPKVGETVTLTLDAPEDATMVMVALNAIEGYSTLIAGAGTVTRESADHYILDVTLYGGTGFTDHFPMSGTITVGAHN